MPHLSVSQQTRLRQLIADRRHPDAIDAFLASQGLTEMDIALLYGEYNLRRDHLLDCYRMKRNVRFVGVAMLAVALGIHQFGGPLVVHLGLAVYAIAIIVTGSLTVYQPSPPMPKPIPLSSPASGYRAHSPRPTP